LGIYALVIYIPDPLGRMLDDLRRELVPHYNPHAHVSVLPPRSLTVDWETASSQARSLAESWNPFDIELTALQVFPETKVLYLEVGQGEAELRRMHASLNSGPLAFAEPFAYHPHVTLAQEVAPDHVPELCELAKRRWAEYRGDRIFRATNAVFVQNTSGNCWADLAEYSFGAVSVK
jgi:2'-5' RNA ligase